MAEFVKAVRLFLDKYPEPNQLNKSTYRVPKPFYRGKSIEVEVDSVVYTFNYVEGTFAGIKLNSLVIVALDKKKKLFTDIWSCDAELDYDVQAHMECILVNDHHKWFDKNHAMARLTTCDEYSFSFTGPNKNTVNMVRMGTKFYASKLN